MLKFQDKAVLVTGASSGIGWHLALLLARRQARLALTARRLERLHELQARIVEQGLPAPLAVPCDVSDPHQVALLRDEVEEAFGGVDVLINNAGRGVYGPIEKVSTEAAQAVVNTNLLGVVYCIQAFLPRMLEKGSGTLVLVSSALGELPAPEHAIYGATKYAVTGLAESLEYELAPKGIKVTLIEPGLVQTEFGQVSGTPPVRYQQLPSKTAAEAADLIIRAIAREDRRCVPDRPARLAIVLRRHFPRMARIITRRVFRRIREE